MQSEPSTGARGPRRPFSLIAKPTGAACNLDCSYCFFLSKEALWDAKSQAMTGETPRAWLVNTSRRSPTGRSPSAGRAASRRCAASTSSARPSLWPTSSSGPAR